jgi:K+ potassium transporter integral membrane domain/Histidine kinase-, DNA gyrase B-, and HSP90-like ATPase
MTASRRSRSTAPFTADTAFTMTPPGDEPIRMRLTEIVPGELFTDEMDGGDFTVRTIHRLEPATGERTRIIYRTEITGPAAGHVGPKLAVTPHGAVPSPFFLLVPGWARPPMVVLAAAATMIVSQAVITGAFSVTQQAAQLGIPAAPWDRMFVPFQRLGDTGNTTGVGLGLALSRGLTEAMGGTPDPEEPPAGSISLLVVLKVLVARNGA